MKSACVQATATTDDEERQGRWVLTFCHRYCGIALMPSTRRRRAASEKVISGMKTEQSTCTHAWPSVGLHARRYESGGG